MSTKFTSEEMAEIANKTLVAIARNYPSISQAELILIIKLMSVSIEAASIKEFVRELIK